MGQLRRNDGAACCVVGDGRSLIPPSPSAASRTGREAQRAMCFLSTHQILFLWLPIGISGFHGCLWAAWCLTTWKCSMAVASSQGVSESKAATRYMDLLFYILFSIFKYISLITSLWSFLIVCCSYFVHLSFNFERPRAPQFEVTAGVAARKWRKIMSKV